MPGSFGNNGNEDGAVASTQSSAKSGVFGFNDATTQPPPGVPGGNGVFGFSKVPHASGVFGANDDQGRVEDMLILQLGDDFSDGLVRMVQGIQQGRAWGSRCIRVPCSGERLSHTDSLKTHPEDSWNTCLACAGVILAVNLV